VAQYKKMIETPLGCTHPHTCHLTATQVTSWPFL